MLVLRFTTVQYVVYNFYNPNTVICFYIEAASPAAFLLLPFTAICS